MTPNPDRRIPSPPSLRQRARVAIGLAILGSAFATGGFAYWSSPGTGQGSAAALSEIAPAVIDKVSFDGVLWPGGPRRDVAVTVSNPNPFPVTIERLTPGRVDSDHPGCGGLDAPSGVTLMVNTGRTVVAPRSSVVGGARASMDATSPSACQGARFVVAFDLVVRQ